jgi:hypothetical protein
MGISPSSNYSLNEKVFSKSKYFKFEMFKITRNSDLEPFSLFTFTKSTSLFHTQLLDNFIHSWKVIRHPLIPPLIDSYEIDQTIYIVTEVLIPFSTYDLKPQEQHWSFYNIISFIDFLNSKSNIIHGNILSENFYLTLEKN